MLISVVLVETEYDSFRQIIDMQELAQRLARPPHDNLTVLLFFGFVEPADERRQHVTGQPIEVVSRSIEVTRHNRNVAAAILLSIGLTELDPGNFGDRVPFVRRLQRAGKQRVFPDRLRREFRIDARRPKEYKAIDPSEMSGVNDIGLNCQIVIDEIRRIGIIGINATDLGSGKYDCFGAVLLQPHLDGKLIPQIDDLARFCGYTIGADCDTTQATRPVPCVTVSITEMGLDCRHDGRWHMNIVILTETPYKYPSLTGDMLFRLWKAAIKDDDMLANEVIRGIYDGMMAFDRERAEDVMDLTVRRHPTSRDAFRALLKDMQVFRS